VTCVSAQDEARYAHQIAVVGRALHRQLTEQRVFMVGAGALGTCVCARVCACVLLTQTAVGCEFLKNFAMMGVGTAGDKGGVVLTDDDSIERSNLSRQVRARVCACVRV
jgi:ubiquitin-activating enzyme E1